MKSFLKLLCVVQLLAATAFAVDPSPTTLVGPAINPSGKGVYLKTDASGNLLTSGAVGGGPQDATQSASVTLPIKKPITGTTVSTTVTNTNLLDSSGAGVATDVRAYNTALLFISSTATTGAYTVQGAYDSAFTTGVTTIPLIEHNTSNGFMQNGSVTLSNGTRTWRVSVTEYPYLRVNLTTGPTTGSVTAYVVLSQATAAPAMQTVTQASGGNLIASINTYPSSAAAADSFANPTITHIGADQMLFNGTSWDRQRGSLTASIGDTGAKTTSFTGAAATNFNFRGAKIFVLISAVSGTSPTLTAQLQISPDGGTTWINYGPASGALTAAGSILIDIYPTNFSTAGGTPATLTTGATQTVFINGTLPRNWRLSYTITGTSPSFTFTNSYFAYTL